MACELLDHLVHPSHRAATLAKILAIGVDVTDPALQARLVASLSPDEAAPILSKLLVQLQNSDAAGRHAVLTGALDVLERLDPPSRAPPLVKIAGSSKLGDAKIWQLVLPAL